MRTSNREAVEAVDRDRIIIQSLPEVLRRIPKKLEAAQHWLVPVARDFELDNRYEN